MILKIFLYNNQYSVCGPSSEVVSSTDFSTSLLCNEEQGTYRINSLLTWMWNGVSGNLQEDLWEPWWTGLPERCCTLS